MEVFEIETKRNKLIITIDKSSVDAVFLANLLNRLRVEQLIKKAEFDEGVLELSRKIKKNWWAKNKKKYLEDGRLWHEFGDLNLNLSGS
jgi:hypothetical protein